MPLSGGPPANPSPDRANGHAPDFGRGANGDGRRKPRRAPSRVTLAPEASAALCKQLVADLAGLATIQDLDRWAQTCLPAKNTLTAADACLVEQAFQGVLNAVGAADAGSTELAPSPGQAAPETGQEAIDKSVLAFPEPRRHRNKNHLRFVAKQPCLICARQPCDCPPFALCAIPRSRSQGQRRIHRAAVPWPSSRTAPRRQ